MALTRTPVKGMKDILPEEMAIRDYAISLIKDTYKTFGFTPIETPCMEHIGNLTSNQGGENESLIFKVLKRGEKLSLEKANTVDDLVDNGLRYDLTVSLCRFYANNMDRLTNPFRALQIGSVWRADRPQKGRYRQFTQCDIDILGDPSMLAEVELINATTTLLARLGFKDFIIRLNHRQLLRAMAGFCGFPEDSSDQVFIILDKMDKIGLAGVKEELIKAGFAPQAVTAYLDFFAAPDETELLARCKEKLTAGPVAPLNGDDVITAKNSNATALEDIQGQGLEAIAALEEIISCVAAAKDAKAQGDFNLVFDPTLVRGMGYYTGPIFEIAMKEFASSVGGGGRYDQLVGSFTNLDVPACGISIGFERIIAILLDQGFSVPREEKKIAFLAERGITGEALTTMLKEAALARSQGATVLVTGKNKNSKYQREQLEKEGYTEFKNFFK